MIRPQKHSRLIVSRDGSQGKRAGLHYIAIIRSRRCNDDSCTSPPPQNRRNPSSRDELGLSVLLGVIPFREFKRELFRNLRRRHGFGESQLAGGAQALESTWAFPGDSPDAP